MDLQTKLEEIAKNLGAFYFGVADLSLARGGPLTPYEERLVSEYPFAISIGVPLSLETVERIGDQGDIAALQSYWFHVYRVVSPLIDHITLQLTLIIMKEGYRAILTDAPLHPGGPTEVGCGKCMVCVEACPADAFLGKNFVPSEPREVRMRAERCNHFLTERGQSIGTRVCGMCVYICPQGKPQHKKSR